MSDEYTAIAMEIIDQISDYIEEEYYLRPKPRLAKIVKKVKVKGDEPALVYGEDYYALEDKIANKVKNLVMRQANKLVHKRVANYRRTK